jgi:hypothetical protein
MIAVERLPLKTGGSLRFRGNIKVTSPGMFRKK